MEAPGLDHPKSIESIDRSGMLRYCEKIPELCEDAVERAWSLMGPDWGVLESSVAGVSLKNIVIAGMGGSAIGGELLKDWLRDRASIPVEVCRDYVLPAYADKSTLVIAMSYSGETEETLSAFADAVKRRCNVLTLSSGGYLQSFSEKLKKPHMKIPSGSPAPRAAIAYLLFPLIAVMQRLKVVKEVHEDVKEAISILGKVREENALSVPLETNRAKKLAVQIENSIPVVYGFRYFAAVARRLKCQFNENCKILSRFDLFSELNHNEIVGWEAPRKLTEKFSAIFIRDSFEPDEIRERIELTKSILSRRACSVAEIHAMGRCRLARMLSAMYVGDLASIYLALLRNVDPTPAEVISDFKRQMKEKLDIVKSLEKELNKQSCL
jgi:glucose/mannose-6-phosphate isomerase